MSPSTNNGGLELPPPVGERQPSPEAPAEAGQNSAERQQPARIEQAPNSNSGSAAAPALGMPQYIPQPIPSSTSVQDDTDDTTAQSSGIRIAQDKDLIEKEWVNKAKAIVERTKDDPYKQSEDLTLLKADYMQKQFNKTLKLSK